MSEFSLLFPAGDVSSSSSPPSPDALQDGIGSAHASVVAQASVVVVVPTAVNVCLMASENISDNLRAQQLADLALPSMYKRAYLIAYETDEIALVRQ